MKVPEHEKMKCPNCSALGDDCGVCADCNKRTCPRDPMPGWAPGPEVRAREPLDNGRIPSSPSIQIQQGDILARVFRNLFDNGWSWNVRDLRTHRNIKSGISEPTEYEAKIRAENCLLLNSPSN